MTIATPAGTPLIYDWNRAAGPDLEPARGRVELDDETLRDGLQSPSVKAPAIEQTASAPRNRFARRRPRVIDFRGVQAAS